MRLIDADALWEELGILYHQNNGKVTWNDALMEIKTAPTIEPEPQIVRCKDCKYWKQQTNYQGIPLSFGFCESDEMWRSLYGETYEVAHIDTDDDFYCGYAERKE